MAAWWTLDTVERDQRQQLKPMKLPWIHMFMCFIETIEIMKDARAFVLCGLIKRQNHPRSNIQFYQVLLAGYPEMIRVRTRWSVQPDASANIFHVTTLQHYTLFRRNYKHIHTVTTHCQHVHVLLSKYFQFVYWHLAMYGRYRSIICPQDFLMWTIRVLEHLSGYSFYTGAAC